MKPMHILFSNFRHLSYNSDCDRRWTNGTYLLRDLHIMIKHSYTYIQHIPKLIPPLKKVSNESCMLKKPCSPKLSSS